MFLGVTVTLAHSIGETIVLRIVTTPPLTGNLIILWVVGECSASPIVTKSLICPTGHIVSPLKPVSDVVAGAIWLWTSGQSRLKQCSKSTSIEEPWKWIFKKRNKKKAKSKQIQARSGKGKVKSHQNEENTT
ncbi:hypothetical protein Tco_1570173 [Tanacetum coccineum]